MCELCNKDVETLKNEVLFLKHEKESLKSALLILIKQTEIMEMRILDALVSINN